MQSHVGDEEESEEEGEDLKEKGNIYKEKSVENGGIEKVESVVVEEMAVKTTKEEMSVSEKIQLAFELPEVEEYKGGKDIYIQFNRNQNVTN
jgi:hypothetical protein